MLPGPHRSLRPAAHPPRTALLFPPLSSFPRVGRQGGGELPHHGNLEKDLPPDFTQTIIRISPIERRRCLHFTRSSSTIFRWIAYLLGLLILALGISMNTKAGLGVSPIISVSFSVSSIWSHNFGNITLVLYTCFILVEVVLHSILLREGSCPAAWVGPFCCWMPCNFL